jgi:enamine deaminase RidA (YjgF/YER057c/UK114 family)
MEKDIRMKTRTRTFKIIMVTGGLFLISACVNHTEKQNSMETLKSTVEYINPDGLHKNPAYSQVVVTNNPAKTIYIGGQNAVNQNGDTIGKGDIRAQAVQILKNLKIALKGGGAGLENVIKWNIYIVQGQSLQPAFEVFQKEMQSIPNPPLITGVFVSGLANPDFLLEIEAIAVVSE